MTDDLLNPVQAGNHLKTKGINHGPGRLANLRAKGKGPEFQRLGKWIRYRRRALIGTPRACSASQCGRPVSRRCRRTVPRWLPHNADRSAGASGVTTTLARPA